MSARDRILARIAAARSGTGASGAPQAHIRRHSRGPIPATDSDLIAGFTERAKLQASDIARADSLSDVPALVVSYLGTDKNPHRAVCWPELANLPWSENRIDVEVRAARGDDVVGITSSFAAIAETGTLMLLSGINSPATVSLLPEVHIAIVPTNRIVATMEDGWELMRANTGKIPRAVNFVSGPSRTADVEQTVTLGAHGPRRVLIVLVRT